MTQSTDQTYGSSELDRTDDRAYRRTTVRPSYRRWDFGTLRRTDHTGHGHDHVRWGAIWGGLLTALGLFLLLSVFGIAVGATVYERPNVSVDDINRSAGVVSAILALLTFLAGGFVAGRAGAIDDKAAGALNGFLVWALAVIAILLATAFGLGGLFGALGGLGNIRELNNPNVDPAQVADSLSTGAWLTFISMALAAAAATLGGFLGAEDDDDHEVVAEA